jgi:hypothetical protein
LWFGLHKSRNNWRMTSWPNGQATYLVGLAK